MGKWIARVEFSDGTEFEKEFRYTANGNYEKEIEEQYNIECAILCTQDKEVTWYSVDYVD